MDNGTYQQKKKSKNQKQNKEGRSRNPKTSSFFNDFFFQDPQHPKALCKLHTTGTSKVSETNWPKFPCATTHNITVILKDQYISKSLDIRFQDYLGKGGGKS